MVAQGGEGEEEEEEREVGGVTLVASQATRGKVKGRTKDMKGED